MNRHDAVQAGPRKVSTLAAIVILLLLVDVFLMATHKLGDFDAWYCLAAGRHLAQTDSLTHEEPFACTVPGTPRHAQTRLSSVLFHAAASAAGIRGVDAQTVKKAIEQARQHGRRPARARART